MAWIFSSPMVVVMVLVLGGTHMHFSISCGGGVFVLQLLGGTHMYSPLMWWCLHAAAFGPRTTITPRGDD